MQTFDDIYKQLVKEVLVNGTDCSSRGLQYRQLFGVDFKVDLREQFPLLTLRKLPIKNIVRELLWDIQGKSDVRELGDAKHFWDFLVKPEDDFILRGSYGQAWTNFPSSSDLQKCAQGQEIYASCAINQLENAIKALKSNPTSRQITVTTTMPHLTNYACPPCSTGFVLSSDGTFLDMLVTWRSQDMCFGLPIDIARYSMMHLWFAEIANLTARFHKNSVANLHIYSNNLDEVSELIRRTPGEVGFIQVKVSDEDLFNPTFLISGYKPNKVFKHSRDSL